MQTSCFSLHTHTQGISSIFVEKERKSERELGREKEKEREQEKERERVTHHNNNSIHRRFRRKKRQNLSTNLTALQKAKFTHNSAPTNQE